MDQIIITPVAAENPDTAQPIVMSALSATPVPPMQFLSEQPPNQWLARVFLGADVQNAAGERLGDINDILFDASGRISIVVLGVGGFLGISEKTVAVQFGALSFGADKDGGRIITVALGKDALMQAPTFHATEKTILDAVKDKAVDFGHRTADKAAELKEHATRKLLDITKPAPVKT